MLVISDFSEGAVVDILADPDGNVTDCANMVTIMGLFIVGRLSKEDAEAKLADRFKGHGFPLLYFTGHETFDTGEVILKRKKPPEDKSSKVEGNAA